MLEETDLISTTNYQPVETPETVQLVYNQKHGRSGMKKTFVLDSGRLQLQPVKETFNLKTVELILGKYMGETVTKSFRSILSKAQKY